MITRRDFLKVTGVAGRGRGPAPPLSGSRSRCPDCLRWFFFHCFFPLCCIRQRGILCRS